MDERHGEIDNIWEDLLSLREEEMMDRVREREEEPSREEGVEEERNPADLLASYVDIFGDLSIPKLRDGISKGDPEARNILTALIEKIKDLQENISKAEIENATIRTNVTALIRERTERDTRISRLERELSSLREGEERVSAVVQVFRDWPMRRITEVDCCPVCLEDLVEGDRVPVLECNHALHMECLIFTHRGDQPLLCPLCRKEILEKLF